MQLNPKNAVETQLLHHIEPNWTQFNLKNASTQFADGGEFGFGAEIGISTDKLHVRGPVGSEHLTSFKYIIHGNGQVR